MILCNVHSPAPHLGACSQVSIFGCGSPVSSWHLLLAPAPDPLSFSPTAWVAIASPTQRYTCAAYLHSLFCLLGACSQVSIFNCRSPYFSTGAAGACSWRRRLAHCRFLTWHGLICILRGNLVLRIFIPFVLDGGLTSSISPCRYLNLHCSHTNH
jgi:hypothetical protein